MPSPSELAWVSVVSVLSDYIPHRMDTPEIEEIENNETLMDPHPRHRISTEMSKLGSNRV